jgi:regulator of extracellular matrix RemA (YlzA/DUF370 family)
MVMSTKVVAVLSPESTPVGSLTDEAKERNMVSDAIPWRKTGSIIITDTNHAVPPVSRVETLTQRFNGGERA